MLRRRGWVPSWFGREGSETGNEAGPWKTSSPGNKSTVTGVFGNIALDGVGENGVG